MRPKEVFRPLDEATMQSYLGKGLHTLGMIEWILNQTGPADVTVTTFSTSKEFLSGFLNLRKKRLVCRACLVADIKAAKKTVKLNALIRSCFEEIYLTENHSKVVQVITPNDLVTVITSQNNTYGGRVESTLVTTDPGTASAIMEGINIMFTHSLNFHGTVTDDYRP